MTPERWRQIEKLYEAGLQRNGAEREAFLEEACEGDEELRREVQSLLAQEEQDQGFLESPALDVAAEELAGENSPSLIGRSLIGRQIASYRVLSLLGKGGMGEVYLAQDEKLDRKAALKFLPRELQQDEAARRRFLREAKSAAALDHPFICHIHEIGETDGAVFIAMEYVPGQRLDQRLAKGPLPLKEALQRAVEIAEALEAAHKQHIVHRDLKPSNILLTPEGHAKVMDFGLAKRLPPEDGEDKPQTATLSRTGMTLGTLPYMSPEQLRGEAVDARSDLFSFGVVLYEMLTAVHPFQKQEAVETGHAILTETPPPLSEHLDRPPVLLQHTLRKLLAKALERRYQHIGDVRLDLEELIREVESPWARETPEPVVQQGPPTRASWREALAWVVAVLALIVSVALWNSLRSLPSDDHPVTRFAIPAGHRMPAIALSPDGARLAYVGTETTESRLGQIYLRDFASVEAKLIRGAENAHSPFFSPDGNWIAVFSGAQLKRVSVGSGPPVTICHLPEGQGSGFGGSWGSDDTIVFSSGAIWRVSAKGGTPRQLSKLDAEAGEMDHAQPQILPGGESVLFTALGASGRELGIWVQALDTGRRRLLVDGGVQAHYLESGYIAYLREGSLAVAPFDLEKLEITGPAVPFIEIGMTGTSRRVSRFAVSRNGALAYLRGSLPSEERRLVWVDREGKEELLDAQPGSYMWPRISPDGTRVAVQVTSSGNSDVWIYDLSRNALRRLTFHSAIDRQPMWTPDGRGVVFSSNRDPGGFNLFRRAADGTGQAERLTSDPNWDRCPWFFTKDGKTHGFTQLNPTSSLDVHLLAMEGGYNSKPLLHEAFAEGSPELSPNGRWIAYRKLEKGRWSIEVRPFPKVQDGRWQVSAEGGFSPLWAPDGRELFYEDRSLGDAMMVVSVETHPAFSHGKPRVLFKGSYARAGARNFDILPDGRRFLMIKEAEQPPSLSTRDEIIVVLNWFEELKRLVPKE